MCASGVPYAGGGVIVHLPQFATARCGRALGPSRHICIVLLQALSVSSAHYWLWKKGQNPADVWHLLVVVIRRVQSP